MSAIKVFFCERAPILRLQLEAVGPGGCGGAGSAQCHCAKRFLADEPCDVGRYPVWNFTRQPGQDTPPDDPRWPTKCDRCDYIFQPDDRKAIDCAMMMRRTDTGELLNIYHMPVGAVWETDTRFDARKGYDGRALVVMTPGGEWRPDRRASNCTLPNDTEHRCWVRHGRPEDGTMHIDKAGLTCAAGGGSILAGGYHGFLHNGHLVPC